MKILLLDSDRSTARALDGQLGAAELRAAHAQGEGLRLLSEGAWDLLLLDADFAGAGLELLRRVRAQVTPAPVVLLAARPSLELAIEAVESGAHEVLPKPLPLRRLHELIAALPGARRVRPLPAEAEPGDRLIGASPEMLAVFQALARAAASDATVLLLGESGTGKELAAKMLHARSARGRGPFVAINCAAIPENLLESELFGHEKGAFTGAIGRRIGRFERASGGTLFLDEIGDMSLALQSKILRALQEREIERVGGAAGVPIDVRIIAATNRELSEEVRAGSFREDLFYRLAVVVVRLPPLRQRGDDLELLSEHFVASYAREYERPIRAVAEEVFSCLRAQGWPGNVRQLRNTLERAVVMSSGAVLLAQHLPPEVARAAGGTAAGGAEEPPLCTLEEMERRMIHRALRETANNLTLAAQRLGIHRNTLRRKMVEHGLREV